jgi:hypothetical protein
MGHTFFEVGSEEARGTAAPSYDGANSGYRRA